MMKGWIVSENNGADTVSPLDPAEGEPDVEARLAPGHVKAEDYETRGQTTVRTRRGRAFVPSDKNLPIVRSTGLKVTKEQAETLVEESNGLVFIDSSDESEED